MNTLLEMTLQFVEMREVKIQYTTISLAIRPAKRVLSTNLKTEQIFVS